MKITIASGENLPIEEVTAEYPKLSEALPTLEANQEQIKDVSMHEIGITDSEDSCPIVGTTGLTSCIGIGGIEVEAPQGEATIGILVHLSPNDSIPETFKKLSDEIEKLYGRSVVMRMGVVASSGRYQKKVSEVEEFLTSSHGEINNLQITPTETRIFQCETQPLGEGSATLEGFAIDTRDSSLNRYAPQKHEIGTHSTNIKLSTHPKQ